MFSNLYRPWFWRFWQNLCLATWARRLLLGLDRPRNRLETGLQGLLLGRPWYQFKPVQQIRWYQFKPVQQSRLQALPRTISFEKDPVLHLIISENPFWKLTIYPHYFVINKLQNFQKKFCQMSICFGFYILSSFPYG